MLMSAHPAPPPAAGRKPLTLVQLQAMRDRGEKIAMMTAYDSSFAALLDAAGIDVILVGDSLGMVVQGHDSTLPVTVEQMAYHTACVARGARSAWVVGDLPFGSYHESTAQAVASATALMRAGARMVKLEGGAWAVPLVRALVERGIPVCGHLGLTPQSVHALGGYRVQGRGDAQAATLRADAHALQEAGASLLVLEMTPSALARELTESLRIPVIGIGAGVHTSGQVLVLHDAIGATAGHVPKFVRNFMEGQPSLAAAVGGYVRAVKDGSFPVEGVHTY
jgi:3-methyl-2-oxobutanoate hydroxymethyltransferase